MRTRCGGDCWGDARRRGRSELTSIPSLHGQFILYCLSQYAVGFPFFCSWKWSKSHRNFFRRKHCNLIKLTLQLRGQSFFPLSPVLAGRRFWSLGVQSFLGVSSWKPCFLFRTEDLRRRRRNHFAEGQRPSSGLLGPLKEIGRASCRERV